MIPIGMPIRNFFIVLIFITDVMFYRKKYYIHKKQRSEKSLRWKIISILFNKLKVLHHFNTDDARDKEREKSGKERTLEFIKKLPEEVYPIIKMSLSSDFQFHSEFNILLQNVKPYQKDEILIK